LLIPAERLSLRGPKWQVHWSHTISPQDLKPKADTIPQAQGKETSTAPMKKKRRLYKRAAHNQQAP